MYYNKENVERLRQRYPEGTRICLDRMNDDPSLLSPVLLTWSITLMTPALCIVSLIMGERSELSQAWTIFTLSEKDRNKPRKK